jgi:uncharacterized protein
MIEIVQLNVYPVKSCRGTSLREATLVETGIDLDRNWMFVDGSGDFLTQREVPALALVEPQVAHGGLELRAPGMPALSLPRDSRCAAARVRIWDEDCPALDEGDTAGRWISDYLGFRARLVRFDPGFKRASNREWTGEITALNRFSDGYPLLVISEASLRDIGARLGQALPANRFRPNIVIAGIEAYEEDYLDLLSGPELALKLVKPCSRCQIVNTDQETGQVGVEPLLTLAAYRGNPRLDGAVSFGQNAVIVEGIGTKLRVGDRLSESWRF